MTTARATRRIHQVAGGSIVAVVLALGAAACGIDEQHRAQPIAPEDLGGLDQTVPPVSTAVGASTRPTPTTIATASTVEGTLPPGSIMTATLFYIDGPALTPVSVDVRSDISLRAFLGRLENGPPQSAVDAGIRSAIPPGLIESVRIAPESVTVDFDPTVLQQVDGSDRPLLIGQIVLTLDAHGIPQVRFTLDGEPLQVLRRDGTLTDEMEFVTADDYEQLLAPEAS